MVIFDCRSGISIKRFETVIRGTLDELQNQVCEDENLQRGEVVIVVGGSDGSCNEYLVNPLQLVTVLSEYFYILQLSLLYLLFFIIYLEKPQLQCYFLK